MLSRRRFLYSAGAAAAAAGFYPTAIETQWLDSTMTPVRVPGLAGGPVRLLHLTDLHASWAVPQILIDRAVDKGLAAEPDLICVTGDFITHREDFDFADCVRSLQRLSGSRPAFAVLGNHDGGSWARSRRGYSDHKLVDRMLYEAGVTLLHNRSTELEIGGRAVTLVGTGDLWSEELDAEAAFRRVRRRSGAPVVLLSHNPDGKTAVRHHDWDLMLCGHTHGGQVMVPFEGPRYAPVEDKRFVAGLREWEEGRQIFVSRGVGSVGSVRFRCRPEVSMLILTGDVLHAAEVN